MGENYAYGALVEPCLVFFQIVPESGRLNDTCCLATPLSYPVQAQIFFLRPSKYFFYFVL
jgi:hypothetical protein